MALPDSPVQPRDLMFVCTGNTCRSPMAERLMRQVCGGQPGWHIHSAGLYAQDGAPPSEAAVVALRERGLDLTDHRARLLQPEDVDGADWIITMTRSHRDGVLERWPEARDKTRTLHSFGVRPEADILDPFGGSLDTYRLTRDEIESALADYILALLGPNPSPTQDNNT